MKSHNWLSKMLLAAACFVAAPAVVVAAPCTGVGQDLDDEVECAINNGLTYLAGVQQPNGAILDQDNIASTGLYCVKLFDRARELRVDPFSADFEYADELLAAIGYVASQIIAGDEGELRTSSGNRTYTTGIAAMCFSASNAPGRTVSTGTGDKTYSEIANGLVTWLNNNQQKSGCGQGGCNIVRHVY